jgi:hypothetical protein
MWNAGTYGILWPELRVTVLPEDMLMDGRLLETRWYAEELVMGITTAERSS